MNSLGLLINSPRDYWGSGRPDLQLMSTLGLSRNRYALNGVPSQHERSRCCEREVVSVPLCGA
jgi:hypothetical protein